MGLILLRTPFGIPISVTTTSPQWRRPGKIRCPGFFLKKVIIILCNDICNDKWYNQIVFQQNNIQTPNTVLIRHSEGGVFAAEKLNAKYPLILKTSIGSRGVGVMFVESERALVGIVQLLYSNCTTYKIVCRKVYIIILTILLYI